MNDLRTENIGIGALEQTVIDEEEFFERELFQDILEMKSVKKVSEATATNLSDLQHQTYQSLYNLFQQARGINPSENDDKDQVFKIFELFFKHFYQHFRESMDVLMEDYSPIQISYVLGKNSSNIINLLDQFIKEMQQELN